MTEMGSLYIVTGSHKLLAEALVENLVKNGKRFILLGRNKLKRSKYYSYSIEHKKYGCTLKDPDSFNELFSAIVSNYHSENKLFVISCWNENKLIIENEDKVLSLFTSLLPKRESFLKVEDRFNASKNLKGKHFKMPFSQLFPFESHTTFYTKPRKHTQSFKVKFNWSIGKSDGYYYESEIQGIEISANIISKNGKIFFYDSFTSLTRWPKTGMSVLKTENKSNLIKKAASELIALIDWCGPINIDFILSGNEVYVIDINPRLWASLSDNIEQNVDIVSLMENLANNDVSLLTMVEMKRRTTHVSPLIHFSILTMGRQEKTTALSILRSSKPSKVSIKSILAALIDRFFYAS